MKKDQVLKPFKAAKGTVWIRVKAERTQVSLETTISRALIRSLNYLFQISAKPINRMTRGGSFVTK